MLLALAAAVSVAVPVGTLAAVEARNVTSAEKLVISLVIAMKVAMVEAITKAAMVVDMEVAPVVVEARLVTPVVVTDTCLVSQLLGLHFEWIEANTISV